MENFQDEGIKSIVLQVLESSETPFTFASILLLIKNKILELENSFPRRELTEAEIYIINKTVWDQIWDRKLMIDFTDERLYHNSEIFNFIKIKNLEVR